MPQKRRRDTLPKSYANAKSAAASDRPRRISRREREEKRQRMLLWGLSIAGALVVLVLIGSALNEYIFKPRTVLASVNGVDITRRDYWKVRSLTLINQINQYQNIASNPGIDPTQQQQYLELAQQAATDLENVWGSTSTDAETLNRMVEDQLYIQNLAELGITITDQDKKDYTDQIFGPGDYPLFTATATQTMIPTRAAWATGTAVAFEQTAIAQETAAAITPTAEGAASPAASPEAAGATPVASPEASGSPASSPESAASPEPTATTPPSAATPVASPDASPAASPMASPDASPMASPVASIEATVQVSPTPNQDQIRQTAEAGYKTYRDRVFEQAHMNEADFQRLYVLPNLARQRVTEVLESQVGQSADQVRAAHILVDTVDLANNLSNLLAQGAVFEDLAREQSNDPGSAANGGDLGWFVSGEMVAEFDQVAFSLEPGQVSQPFQSEYGWHIIKLYEKESDRPMTDSQIQKLKAKVVQDWIEAKRAAAKIDTVIEPTPTPSISEFEPPAEVPPLPTPTTIPASPEASPVASPVASPAASPVASPAAAASPVS